MKLYKIKKSDIDKKGRGLYATKDIKEGTKIIDYVGKLITKKQTEESDKYDNPHQTLRAMMGCALAIAPNCPNGTALQNSTRKPAPKALVPR